MGLALKVQGDQIGSILGGGPACAGNERGVAMCAERMQCLAQLRRSLCVYPYRSLGAILPANRVVTLPGIPKEITPPADRGRCIGRNLVRLSDNSE